MLIFTSCTTFAPPSLFIGEFQKCLTLESSTVNVYFSRGFCKMPEDQQKSSAVIKTIQNSNNIFLNVEIFIYWKEKY